MRVWLKDARNNIGITQQSVSEQLGISRQYYNQIETGIRKMKMDIVIVNKLSEILNIPVEQVIENENQFYENVQMIRKKSKNGGKLK